MTRPLDGIGQRGDQVGEVSPPIGEVEMGWIAIGQSQHLVDTDESASEIREGVARSGAACTQRGKAVAWPLLGAGHTRVPP